MRVLIAGFVAALMAGLWPAAGYTTETGYPEGYLDTITQACVDDGVPREACACFSGRLATDVSYSDFSAMNQAAQAEQLHASMPQVARMMDSCNPPATAPAAVAPGYTASYVNNFMGDCAVDPRDTGYCLCAVAAIQSLISFDEAIAYDRLNSWRRPYEHPRHMDIMAAWFACADQTRTERLSGKRR